MARTTTPLPPNSGNNMVAPCFQRLLLLDRSSACEEIYDPTSFLARLRRHWNDRPRSAKKSPRRPDVGVARAGAAGGRAP